MTKHRIDDALMTYKSAGGPLADTNRYLPLYGAGFNNLGVRGRPVEGPMPSYAPDQLLVRHDACSLCYSDIKVIRQGGTHPRLLGKDLSKDPVILGHELALTVVGVGEELRETYYVGQRFTMQVDVYYKGRGMAYGYILAGALSHYGVLGDEVLRGDDGCYLLPVKSETGYAEVALTEPWACVDAAYHIQYRTRLKVGGTAWFIGYPGTPDLDYFCSQGLDGKGHPQRLITSCLPPAFSAWLATRAGSLGIPVEQHDEMTPGSLTELAKALAPGGIDDVILLGPAPADLVGAAGAILARGGILNLVSSLPLEGPVPVDLGRMHYDRTAVFGCQGPDIAESYRPVRTALKPGGKEWVLGASGPMGHMHVQRALEMPPSPSLIVATNLRSPRIAGLSEKFANTCREKHIELLTLTEELPGRDIFVASLLELTGGRGFDDVIILAPDAAAVPQAMQFAAPDSVINLFVGLPRFKTTLIDLNPLIDRWHVRLIGSSGSVIDDLQRMLDLTESGRLVTNRSVAAIAGLDGAWDGMRALEEGRFPGKVLIYPHLRNLSLTSLEELPVRLPGVAALLDPGFVWNNRAEEELFRELL